MSSVVRVWVGSVETTPTDVGLCSDDERARAAGFRSPAVADRWLAGRAAVRTILGTALGTDPAGLAFGKAPLGKLAIAGHPAVEFSHAHSGAWVAIALSDEPVGIDLEAPRQLLRPERLARRLGLEAGAGPQTVLQHWTRTEALLKATGEGVRSSLHGVESRLGALGWTVRDLPAAADATSGASAVIGAVAAYGHQWDILMI